MTAMDKQQLWWQRGNNDAANNCKQQPTNAQHVQLLTSNDGRMRWRMMAAEEMRQMEQRTSKFGRWRKGDNNTDNNNKKQQST
jgi:hypothetical protein